MIEYVVGVQSESGELRFISRLNASLLGCLNFKVDVDEIDAETESAFIVKLQDGVEPSRQFRWSFALSRWKPFYE